MAEGKIKLSRNDLLSFLDFVGEKGLLKKVTADNLKIACNVVLRILDDTEASDLSKIDLNAVIMRHRNKAAGKITPGTLQTYESRVRRAVREFFAYAENPSSWRPGVQPRRSRGAPIKKTKTVSSVSKPQELEKPEAIPSELAVHIDFQIHISPEATPEQIDQIFESMRRHLYGGKVGK